MKNHENDILHKKILKMSKNYHMYLKNIER